MMRRLFSISLAGLLLASICLGNAQDPESFLQKHFSLSRTELSNLRKGEVIGKILDPKKKTEVAVLGIMRVNVPKEFIVSKIKKITSFKKGKEVLQIGMLNNLTVQDLKGFTLDKGDLDAIRDCKTGDCDLKLPATWIKRFQKETDPRSRNYTDQANTLMRALLVEYSANYLIKGNEGLVEYNSGKKALRLSDEFQDILHQSPYMSKVAPDFYEYLKEFPRKDLPDTEGFIYWSREKFGFKPVISLTHVIIHQQNDEGSSRFLIASKQIFADHYYDGSLGWTILMDDPQNKKGCYLIYINRSRIDALGGFLSGLRRAIAQPRIRSGMESNLKLMKQRLESEYKPE